MSDPQYTSRRDLRTKRRNPLALVLACGIISSLVAGIGYANRVSLRGFYEQVTGADYFGDGGPLVQITIKRGDDGIDVANELVNADVTKSYDITLRTIYALNPTFFPGTYELPSKISAAKAVSYLVDPRNAVSNRVTIREGLRIAKVFDLLSSATGIPKNSFEEAAKDTARYGVPNDAPTLEGYLFPATYTFDLSATAEEILQILVDRTKEQLIEDGVAKKDWHKVLTLASIIQSEARMEPDFYKVSRVFLNRIAIGMHLQSDATVSYGVGGDTVETSYADRTDPNPYNTYKYAGLPIGPISGVGALAIDAALNPAQGKWLYFVTVNLNTGETVFSETYAQHKEAIKLWGQWLKENPDWND